MSCTLSGPEDRPLLGIESVHGGSSFLRTTPSFLFRALPVAGRPLFATARAWSGEWHPGRRPRDIAGVGTLAAVAVAVEVVVGSLLAIGRATAAAMATMAEAAESSTATIPTTFTATITTITDTPLATDGIEQAAATVEVPPTRHSQTATAPAPKVVAMTAPAATAAGTAATAAANGDGAAAVATPPRAVRGKEAHKALSRPLRLK